MMATHSQAGTTRGGYRLFILAMFALQLAGANLAQAAFVDLINDNFNSENGGVGQYNYSGFANFNVTRPSVDLLPRNANEWQIPGHGMFVDLDGSSQSGGKMESKLNSLPAGTYQLSFDLAGSQRPDFNLTDTVTVSLGSLFSTTITLPFNTPFTTFNFVINAGTATAGTLAFDQAGGDNQGLLLDNVRLAFQAAANPVPEPATLFLWGLGAFGTVVYDRRRRRQAKLAAA